MEEQEQREKRYKRIWKNLEAIYRKKNDVYQDIRDFLAPGTGMFDKTQDLENDNINYRRLLDSEPVTYLDTTVAGLYGGLINPATRWFELTVDKSDPKFSKYDLNDIFTFLADSKEMLYFMFAKSNFYSAMKNIISEWVRYGLGVMLIEERDYDFIFFNPLTIGEYYLGINDKGEYTKMARKLAMTADQIVEKFGLENCPDRVKNAYERGDYERLFTVKHLICENPKDGFIGDSFKFVDLYWMEGAGEPFGILRKGGFKSNPIIVFAWERKNLRTVYPMGIGEKMIGDVKELQHTVRVIGMNKNYIENPALALHTSLGRGKVVPGARFYTDQDPSKVATEIFRVNNYLEALESSRQILLDKINKMSYAQILMLFAQKDRAAMTATEANAIVSEQMTLLAPIYLQAKDGLESIFKRVIDICARRGWFPENLPIKPNDINLEFISSIAKAQRMAEIGSTQELLQYIAALSQIKPGANDYIDEDKIIVDIAERLGSGKFIRSQKEVEEYRQIQAEQQQQLEQMQLQAAQMKIAKDASKAKIEPNNMLGQQVLEQGGQIPADPKLELERQKQAMNVNNAAMRGGF